MRQKKHQKEINELKAGWQRTQADFDNFRKRIETEKKEWLSQGKIELICELLPVLDNFDRAVSHLTCAQKKDPTVSGILHIQGQLTAILENLGVKKISPRAGDAFDPVYHEAIESRNGQGGTKITAVSLAGYQLGDTVLRPARVAVG